MNLPDAWIFKADLLAGRTALVTGARKDSIGHGVAEALVLAGATVIIHEETEDLVSQTADALLEQGLHVEQVFADFGVEKDVSDLVQKLSHRRAAIDIVVNVAGVTASELELSGGPEAEQRLWNINLFSPKRITKALITKMTEKGGGTIVNFSSLHQFQAFRGFGAYASTKAAISAWTRSLTVDYGQDGIAAVSIAPGFVDVARHAQQGLTVREASKFVPTGLIAKPLDLGNLTVFLCTPSGAFFSGQTLIFDAGRSIAARGS